MFFLVLFHCIFCVLIFVYLSCTNKDNNNNSLREGDGAFSGACWRYSVMYWFKLAGRSIVGSAAFRIYNLLDVSFMFTIIIVSFIKRTGSDEAC